MRDRDHTNGRSQQHILLLAAAFLMSLSVTPGLAQTAAPAGASSCSGCHDAPLANSTVPPLKGRPAAELVTAMQEFRTGKRSATVMDRIAKGFTEEETSAIASWLSQK